MIPLSLVLGVALGLSAWTPGQEPGDIPSFQPARMAFPAWQADHPGDWILRTRDETAAGRFLYGGSLAPSAPPASDADFVALARAGLAETQQLFPVAAETLQVDAVRTLPLAQAGIQDKVAVSFRQVHQGVPVVGGFVDVLFLADGRLTAIDCQAYPGVEELDVRPSVGAERAVREAMRWFAETESVNASFRGQPELVIQADRSGKLAEPRLAWAVELRNDQRSGLPAGRRVYVAADGAAPAVIANDQLVHECGFCHAHDHAHDHSGDEDGASVPLDISGHVESWATPGTLPDKASNPETLHPMRHMRVTSAVGSTHTDLNGDFLIPYTGTSPVDLTFEYRGLYCRVYNQAGATYSHTQSYTPGVPADAILNDLRTEYHTAHANAFRCVNDMREFIREIDPSDDTADFQMRANVNISSTCNAYFDGSSINFYRTGGGCVNTAFSTVVAHEEGHWLNVLYSSGNGSDGFGEGAADVWAMYLYDTPYVGEDFCGTGCDIRSGLNTRQWCGSGCYGQVHTDGEVLMGALWKVRANLNTSLGNAAGDLVADTLMLAWFNGYNDGQILPVIEDHWLALDDDDGNIGNGTPNFDDIDAGFRAQGFPGVDLDYISFVHAAQGDTQEEVNPYGLLATLTPEFGSSVVSADIHYSVDGGAEQTVAMTPIGGGDWIGAIPAQPSPSRVAYWISAEDDLGNTDRYPKKSDIEFLVGLRRIAYFTDFETAGADGWTHEYGGGTSNDHDDWQHDSPKGKGGDPSGAFSGNLVWANDVGNSGWNGLYQPNVNIRLMSPSIDCSDHSNLRLRFARWLTVEKGQYDNARLRVAGNLVWSNDNAVDHVDTAWTMADYDVSAYADGNPDVELRWVLRTDGGLEYGGWTLDDVMLYSLLPSGSNDTIALTGDENPLAGSTANYQFSNGPANGAWYAAYSPNLNGSTVQGHLFDVGPGYQLAGQGSFDAEGVGSISIPVPANAAGVVVHLEIAGRDAEGYFTDSNPLTVMVQ